MGFLIGALFAAAAAVVGSVLGYKSNAATNQTNKDIADSTNQTQIDIADSTNAQQKEMFDEQMDWTRYVQEQEWQRADTSQQRAVADAQAAGLSPLAALGISNHGSIASMPSAPNLHMPQMALAQMSPYNPSQFLNFFDLSRSLLDIYKNDRSLSSEQKIERFKQHSEDERFFAQLQQVSKLTQQQLASDESKFSRQLSENIRQFDSNLEFLRGENNRNYALQEMDTMSNLAMKITGNSSGVYNKVKNFNDWRALFRKWSDDYASEAEKITADFQSYSMSHGESSSSSSSSNDSGNVNLGLAGVSSGVGVGMARSTGESSSVSDSESKSQSFSEYWKHRMAAWFAKNPIPIYSAY